MADNSPKGPIHSEAKNEESDKGFTTGQKLVFLLEAILLVGVWWLMDWKGGVVGGRPLGKPTEIGGLMFAAEDRRSYGDSVYTISSTENHEYLGINWASGTEFMIIGDAISSINSSGPVEAFGVHWPNESRFGVGDKRLRSVTVGWGFNLNMVEILSGALFLVDEDETLSGGDCRYPMEETESADQSFTCTIENGEVRTVTTKNYLKFQGAFLGPGSQLLLGEKGKIERVRLTQNHLIEGQNRVAGDVFDVKLGNFHFSHNSPESRLGRWKGENEEAQIQAHREYLGDAKYLGVNPEVTNWRENLFLLQADLMWDGVKLARGTKVSICGSSCVEVTAEFPDGFTYRGKTLGGPASVFFKNKQVERIHYTLAGNEELKGVHWPKGTQITAFAKLTPIEASFVDEVEFEHGTRGSSGIYNFRNRKLKRLVVSGDSTSLGGILWKAESVILFDDRGRLSIVFTRSGQSLEGEALVGERIIEFGKDQKPKKIHVLSELRGYPIL